MIKRSIIALLTAGATAACATPFSDVPEKPPALPKVEETAKVVPIETIHYPSWKCVGCTPAEARVVEYLQQKTKIQDKNALATILGNIKQESNFVHNVCEGGARVSYSNCLRGGYGLIQWTSTGRYLGLGKFCKRYGCDPSSFEGQLRYMVNEPQFRKVLPEFEGRGQPIHQYMVAAYYWLGWGIKGRRETYAYQYLNKLVYA